MKTSAHVWSACLVVCCAVAHAQKSMPSLSIGNTKIAMGAPEDKTLALLQQRYQNIHLATELGAHVQEWSIFTGRDMYSYPEVDVYAKNNRIIGAEFAQELGSMDEAFDALFAMASKLAAEGHKACVISNWTGYVPASDVDLSLSKASVDMECGGYQLTLLRNQFKNSNGKLVSGYMLLESFGTTITAPPVPPTS